MVMGQSESYLSSNLRNSTHEKIQLVSLLLQVSQSVFSSAQKGIFITFLQEIRY